MLTVQFTLCHVLKGNKPDFHNALTSEKSEPMYKDFIEMLGKMYSPDKIKRELCVFYLCMWCVGLHK